MCWNRVAAMRILGELAPGGIEGIARARCDLLGLDTDGIWAMSEEEATRKGEDPVEVFVTVIAMIEERLEDLPCTR